MNSVVKKTKLLIYMWFIIMFVFIGIIVWCLCKICKECCCKYVITSLVCVNRCVDFVCKYFIYVTVHYPICVYWYYCKFGVYVKYLNKICYVTVADSDFQNVNGDGHCILYALRLSFRHQKITMCMKLPSYRTMLKDIAKDWWTQESTHHPWDEQVFTHKRLSNWLCWSDTIDSGQFVRH